MNDAFHITRGSLASGLFRQFRERARLRYKYVDQVAAHGSGNSPNGTERDAVLGFGLFELLDGLSRCPHFLADLALAKAEGLARSLPPRPSGGWIAIRRRDEEGGSARARGFGPIGRLAAV